MIEDYYDSYEENLLKLMKVSNVFGISLNGGIPTMSTRFDKISFMVEKIHHLNFLLEKLLLI